VSGVAPLSWNDVHYVVRSGCSIRSNYYAGLVPTKYASLLPLNMPHLYTAKMTRKGVTTIRCTWCWKEQK
jgi:hypothetical protein